MDNKELPAFPFEYKNQDGTTYKYGLNKREYFAGLAMQGLLARSDYKNGHEQIPINLSVDAVRFADELLTQLSK